MAVTEISSKLQPFSTAANRDSALTRAFSTIAFYGTLATIGLAAIPYGSVEQWSKATVVSLLCLCAVFRIGDLILRNETAFKGKSVLLPVFGLILLAILQIVPFSNGATISYDPYETTNFVIQCVAYLIAFEILLTYTDTTAKLKILVAFVFGAAFLTALFGLTRDWFLGTEGGFLDKYFLPGVGFGQYINRNHFVFLMEMALGLLIGLILKGNFSEGYKFLGWVLGGYLIVISIMVNSRGGILSLVGLFIMAFFLHFITKKEDFDGERGISRRRRSGKKPDILPKLLKAFAAAALVFGIFVFIIAFVGGDTVVNRIEDLQGEVKNVETQDFDRAQIWRSTIEMIKDHPVLGVGLGAYGAAITRYDSSGGAFTLQQAHNDYLELLACSGIVGFVLCLAFGWLVWRQIAVQLDSKDFFRRASCFGALLGVIGVLIHSMVDFGLHPPFNALVLIVLLVIACADIEIEEGEDHSRSGENARDFYRKSRAS